MKFATLPLWAIAFFGISAACFLVIYWNSFWKTQARSFVRVVVFVSLANIAQAALMSVDSGTNAQFVYSVFLPIVFFEQISVIEAFIVTFGLRKPVWYSRLWVIGGLFLMASIAFHAQLYPVLRPVPDGYFFSSPTGAWVFLLLKAVVYGVNLVALLTVVVLGLRRQGYRRRWPYALTVFLYGVCFVNDSLVIQHHRTLYPTTWLAAVVFLGMLWREVRWHMRDVYKRLNHDSLTGAHSRSFGELYLAQILQTQDVGLVYADIDDFKQVNDAHGHQAGDRVLELFVELMTPYMTKPNALVRLGGDEFLFILPSAHEDDEHKVRKEIISLLEGTLHVGNQHEAVLTPLRVSLGWAYARKGSSWANMVHHADLAMYEQKVSHPNVSLT